MTPDRSAPSAGISPLPLRRLLDGRDSDAAALKPIRDAVNIPAAELRGRTHELPGKGVTILVAGPQAAVDCTRDQLIALERKSEVAYDWTYETDQNAARSIGRLWRPAAFLENGVAAMRPGRALDLACGTGRDAVFLAASGWQVTGVDSLEDALERARDRQRRYAPAARIQWVRADLNRATYAPAGSFDLITCFRFLDRGLLQRLPAWLSPAGSVLFETFGAPHRERHGKPASDAHLLAIGEIDELARRWERDWGLSVSACNEEWRMSEDFAREVYTGRIQARRR